MFSISNIRNTLGRNGRAHLIRDSNGPEQRVYLTTKNKTLHANEGTYKYTFDTKDDFKLTVNLARFASFKDTDYVNVFVTNDGKSTFIDVAKFYMITHKQNIPQ
jgi:hypothetical protein